jgi:molybdopterin-binding protein
MPRREATFAGASEALALALRNKAIAIIIEARGRAANGQRQEKTMKISARNVLRGAIVDVKKGATTAHVTIDVKGTIVTASITNESVDELKLAKGKEAFAVIKSSDVMVGVE